MKSTRMKSIKQYVNVGLLVGGLLSLLPSFAFAQTTVTGEVYLDVNADAVSIRHQQRDRMDRGLGEMEVDLLGPQAVHQAWTRAFGDFSFEEVPDGTYLMTVTADMTSLYCSSHNLPSRLPQAVLEGHVQLVAFGDSLAVTGSDRTFPTRVADYLSALAAVDLRNVAIGGSTAAQWVPGTPYFEDILVPALEDADLVMFSLGGNDFGAYFGEPPYDQGEFVQLLAGFPEAYQGIKEDLVAIAEEIHTRFPDVDVAYIVYPNFVNTTVFETYLGDLWPTAKKVVYAVFSDMRNAMAALDYVILIDMLDALGPEPIDDLLIDAVHSNDAGHQAYADEIFYTIGGVVVGTTPLGLDRSYALAPRVLE